MDARMIAPRPTQASNHCAGKTRVRLHGNGAFCGLPGCTTRIADRSVEPFDLIEKYQEHLDRKHPAPTTVSAGAVPAIGSRLGPAKVIALRSRA